MKKKIFNFFSSYTPSILKVFGSKSSLRIVYYHRINEELVSYYFDTGINPNYFRMQLEHLVSRYKVLSLPEAIDMAENGIKFDNHVCLTFDDGFSECYNVIAPILEDFGIKATFFITEKCIDNKDMIWRNKLLVVQKELEKNRKNLVKQLFHEEFNIELSDNILISSNSWPMAHKDVMADFLWKESQLCPLEDYISQTEPYLTERQIFSLLDRGHSIGSHTYSHPFCNKLTKSEIDYEIIDSAERLSKRFSFDCNLFSYPFGSTVSPSMEKYIIDNSRLKMLFGIKDNLNNKLVKPRWERIVMEKTYDDSLYSFYVTPSVRKLFTTKNKHH